MKRIKINAFSLILTVLISTALSPTEMRAFAVDNREELTLAIDGVVGWNYRLLPKSSKYEGDSLYIVRLECSNVECGYTLQKIDYTDGIWTVRSEGNEDIKLFPGSIDIGPPRDIFTYLVPASESGYVLTFDNLQNFETMINYEQGGMIATASSASQIVFHHSGYTEIIGEENEYSVKIVYNDPYRYGTWNFFDIAGCADTVSIRMTDNGYILKSDNMRNVSVNGNYRTNFMNEVITHNLKFSSLADTVLLFEVGEGEVAAAIDQDKDGIFDTTIARSDALGDVNSDGHINAVDAAEILVAAATAGSGTESGLTLLQEFAADVDAGGSFNATDAALLLCYAAEVGTGSQLTLKEYVALNQE